MPDTPPPPKPTCPNCGVEIEGAPETCAKCGLELSSFPSFYKMMRAALRQFASEEEAERKEKDKGKPPASKKFSTLDYIRGRKKA